MRFRFLLLLVAAAAIASIAVPAAGALTFPDDVCPVRTGTVIKVCPTGETGKSYSYQIRGREGTGCVPYVTFRSVGTMPPGLSIASGGLISGTPAQTGTYTFYIEMKDIPTSQGGAPWCGESTKSTERMFEISIVQGLQIQQRQSVLTPGQLTVPYNLQFTATGGSPTWTITSGSLPAGLTLNSAGLLSGTPTATGDFSFKVNASSGGRSDTQTYSMSVVEPLKLAASKPVGEVGIAFQLTPQTTGGKQGYTFSLEGTLPAGLAINNATGAISGKPTAAGASTAKLIVKDALGLTSTLDLHFNIVAPLAITKTPLKAAKVGTKYRIFLKSTGGARPRSWVMLGGRPGILPPGLKLNARTGELSGTPKKAGVYRLRLQVGDALGAHSAAGFVLKVSA
jgi:hypothetical protein